MTMSLFGGVFLAALLGGFIGYMLGINVRFLMSYRDARKLFGGKNGKG